MSSVVSARHVHQDVRIKRSLCIKYINFLSYLKKCKLKRPWHRYYCCVFQMAGVEMTSVKGLTCKSLQNSTKVSRNKDTFFIKCMNHLISKPINIASFDLDGTLMNIHGCKHTNTLLFSKEVLFNIFNFKEKQKFQIVIFSNQTSVSSPVHDYHYLKRCKLPILFRKLVNLRRALSYFYALYRHQNGGKFKAVPTSQNLQKCQAVPTSQNLQKCQALPTSQNLQKCQALPTSQACEKWNYRVHGKHCVVVVPNQKCHGERCFQKLNYRRSAMGSSKMRRSNENSDKIKSIEKRGGNVVNTFYAIGKGNMEPIDIYPKPCGGQYYLYMCLEGIKYIIILIRYFGNLHKELLEKEINKGVNKPLEDFLRLTIEICNNEEIYNIVKKNRRCYFHLNTMSLQMIEIYINSLLKKSKFYIFLKNGYPQYVGYVNYFLNDFVEESPPWDEEDLKQLLKDECFLKHLTLCLVYKNKIMKNLSAIFSNLLFNFDHSFYVGDNIGRDFDKSNIDLKVSIFVHIYSHTLLFIFSLNKGLISLVLLIFPSNHIHLSVRLFFFFFFLSESFLFILS
ncbi:conserved Plasmodium protein, unknown function [Plasmodium gonderi]|uniref:Phosphatase n=1 Tax=Plasmodium gonderi TaxID=77519 RepID=A0A1Y1JH17_PLAGO|nr:conserved Plasmodium protein, unknown function [Plasmodium gonderi]GAW79733.1 conserved Plasmodium protein, unknown function [Plasmodium gonderi]